MIIIKNKDKKATLFVENYEIEPLNDSRFSRLRMWISHDGVNNNKSNIDFDVLKNAESSVVNIPILAHIEGDDFGEHEMEYDEDEDKITYIEKPIGVISAVNNNYHYEEIDGRNYAVVDGYIWNVYAQDEMDIINNQEETKLSIEIVIDESEYNKETKILNIRSFRYTGVTLLGNKYGTGMINAHAKIEHFSLDDDFTKKMKELNSFLHHFNDANTQTDKSKEDNVQLQKNKKEIAALFKLTTNQLYEEIDNALSKQKYIGTNWYGESVERCSYYLSDFDENYIYLCDVQDGYKYKKASYSMQGDNVVIDFNTLTRIKYSPVDWVDGDEADDAINTFKSTIDLISSEATEVLNKEKNEKETLVAEFTEKIESKDEAILSLNQTLTEIQEKFTEVESQITNKDEKITELQKEILKFKEAEDVERIDELFNSYPTLLTEDEKAKFTEKRSSFATFSEFEKEVKSYVCDRIIETTKSKNFNFISMGLPDDGEQNKETPKTVWDRLSQQNN
ncbi:hypothetical protein HFE03_07275 [Paenibacillus sp. EKM102P]|uniref:coiled-coil domain-containing protein n=1 Tax=Paenibacillus TaxID=44249 RepID=UPI000AF7A3F9|nr:MULTISPECIES: hypothetical protein [Paenibacillus]KAF6620448.1 hypothetical protein HFE00_05180 [Paenibacillus sp. EKM101P]KAF6623440.1 hypothetical protein HFE03_07275 [Paenibacillus sp. EKM102P]KAF6633998.1 hypothetical protein HFE01_07235 [Paenibacillus sp. EKM10P]KAF6649524.1 hypothetical protein HFE02_02195 [Paenibacillus sp. EKM11P]